MCRNKQLRLFLSSLAITSSLYAMEKPEVLSIEEIKKICSDVLDGKLEEGDPKYQKMLKQTNDPLFGRKNHEQIDDFLFPIQDQKRLLKLEILKKTKTIDHHQGHIMRQITKILTDRFEKIQKNDPQNYPSYILILEKVKNLVQKYPAPDKADIHSLSEQTKNACLSSDKTLMTRRFLDSWNAFKELALAKNDVSYKNIKENVKGIDALIENYLKNTFYYKMAIRTFNNGGVCYGIGALWCYCMMNTKNYDFVPYTGEDAEMQEQLLKKSYKRSRKLGKKFSNLKEWEAMTQKPHDIHWFNDVVQKIVFWEPNNNKPYIENGDIDQFIQFVRLFQGSQQKGDLFPFQKDEEKVLGKKLFEFNALYLEWIKYKSDFHGALLPVIGKLNMTNDDLLSKIFPKDIIDFKEDNMANFQIFLKKQNESFKELIAKANDYNASLPPKEGSANSVNIPSLEKEIEQLEKTLELAKENVSNTDDSDQPNVTQKLKKSIKKDIESLLTKIDPIAKEGALEILALYMNGLNQIMKYHYSFATFAVKANQIIDHVKWIIIPELKNSQPIAIPTFDFDKMEKDLDDLIKEPKIVMKDFELSTLQKLLEDTTHKMNFYHKSAPGEHRLSKEGLKKAIQSWILPKTIIYISSSDAVKGGAGHAVYAYKISDEKNAPIYYYDANYRCGAVCVKDSNELVDEVWNSMVTMCEFKNPKFQITLCGFEESKKDENGNPLKQLPDPKQFQMPEDLRDSAWNIS